MGVPGLLSNTSNLLLCVFLDAELIDRISVYLPSNHYPVIIHFLSPPLFQPLAFRCEPFNFSSSRYGLLPTTVSGKPTGKRMSLRQHIGPELAQNHCPPSHLNCFQIKPTAHYANFGSLGGFTLTVVMPLVFTLNSHWGSQTAVALSCNQRQIELKLCEKFRMITALFDMDCHLPVIQ